MAGRKSLKEEIKIVERMAELSEPVFKFVRGMFEVGEKDDKKWATEQMMKLYAKAVPQKIGGDSDNPIPIMSIQYVPTDNSNPQDTENEEAYQGDTGGNVGEQDDFNPDLPDSAEPARQE